MGIMSPAIHPVAEPPTVANPNVIKYKIPKETEFDHAYEVVVVLGLEYKNIKFSVKPNLVGDLILSPQDNNTAKILSEVTNLYGRTVTIIPLDPEEKTTRMVLLRYPLELPVEVIIKHPKVAKAERCVTSQDKAQTRQVLVDIKGTVPEEVDLGNWGTYKLRPFVPEPLRCYKCQKFGHHQSRCHKNVRCGICSQSHMTEMCIQKYKDGTTTTAKCPNCGKKHHTWSTSCPERRERMKVAMAKVQPQYRTRAPQSTFVWGQQRQNTVNPTPTPPQLSEDSFPALPPPGFRTKLKTPGQNQSMQETMTNQWTSQPQLQSCVAVKGQNTPVLAQNIILPGTLQPLQATTQLNTLQPANLQAAFTEEQMKQMITIMIVTFSTIRKTQDTSTENIINAVMTQLTEKMQGDQTPKTPQLRVEQTTPLKQRQTSDKRMNLPSKRSPKTVKPQAPCNRSRGIEQRAQTVSKHTITDKSDRTLKREKEKTPEVPPPAPPSEQVPTTPNGRGGERLNHERREQLQHQRRGDNDRIASPPFNLKISQWNVQGLSNKRHTVQAAVTAKNIDVFILQETMKSKNKQFRLPGYQQYSVPKGPNSHGSMILVRATILSSEVNQFTVQME
ncbi:Nucleic-acid-binding protein from mobile element jockey-like 2 [Homarus americanus]|uniref:Nucleic-acid-binding protein from mobile element jockey-like 2 n=1 Tax=Homarus americanus TaxID=6706 RepID=A0A8J5MUY8_HOMAM|nr:Nucleic-acid-binding protein from mobile element jockey-like 2 [Homarus americanus]